MITPLLFAPFLGAENNSTSANATDLILQSLKDENQDGFFENLISKLFETTKYSNLWIPYMILSFLKISIFVAIVIAYMIKVRKMSVFSLTKFCAIINLGMFEKFRFQLLGISLPIISYF